MDVAFQSMQME